MENIIKIAEYNTQLEIFHLVLFPKKILNNSFAFKILVIGNVERQWKEYENLNDNANIILNVFNINHGNNYHNER